MYGENTQKRKLGEVHFVFLGLDGSGKSSLIGHLGNHEDDQIHSTHGFN